MASAWSGRNQLQTVAKMVRDMGHARQSVQRIADLLESEGLIANRDPRRRDGKE
ncbi:hypothetical protein [Paenibacillus macquariensis]|uniref:hypothetical protein n=1 Tax=Paenibacillus macquariensis TaxID=948756 RepID=UPI0012E834B9|nr:hypothetical protein [Paenibacillus macquariensis]